MWAKQSTAATLVVGPVLDSTGAEYTSAVIGDLSISKNGGTLTALAAAATLTHIANGQYTLVMTTGNLDTLGRLQITCNKSTYQMPPVGLNIVPADRYDSLVLGTDRFDANVTHVGDTSQTAGDIYASQVAIAGYIDTEVSAIKAKTDNLPSDPADQSAVEAAITAATSPLATQASVNTIDDFLDTEIAAIKTKTDQLTFTTANKVDSTAVLDSAAILAVADQVWDEAMSGHTTAGTYGGRIVRATNSNTEVQITGSNHIAADIHDLQSGVISAGDFAANAITASALATDAVTEIQSGLASQSSVDTLTSYVDTEVAAIKAKTDNLPSDPADASDIASSFSTVNTKLDTIDDFLDTEVAAIKAKTDNLPSDPADQSLVEAAITAATSPLATPAQVNAQVLDVLSVDTFAELSAPPAATSSLKDKITWLFMYARNKVTQTATQRKVYLDDGTTVAGTSATTDNGTTFTKGEDA